MTVTAYGARAADQPFEAMTIERRTPGSRDVQIEIAYCGICHSDLHTVRSEWPGTLYPCVPGHEIVGRVSAIGDAVTRFEVGDTVGVAVGSVAINRLLKGQVSARYAVPSVLAMGLFVVAFYYLSVRWPTLPGDSLYTIGEFMVLTGAWPLLGALLGVAVAGGMFVVPLYAFLTTTVPKAQAARTVAANNIVNSGAMVAGSLLAVGMSVAGLPTADQLLLAAAMCLISAWLAWKLHKACDDNVCADREDLPPDV